MGLPISNKSATRQQLLEKLGKIKTAAAPAKPLETPSRFSSLLKRIFTSPQTPEQPVPRAPQKDAGIQAAARAPAQATGTRLEKPEKKPAIVARQEAHAKPVTTTK